MENKTVTKTFFAPEEVQIPNATSNYNLCRGFNNELCCSTVEEIIKMVKERGLTIRQAQQVFIICSDYILDHMFN